MLQLGPLSKILKLNRRRKRKAKELADLCDQFLDQFDTIYDDLEGVEIEAKAFMSNYNRLEDTSRSFKKHMLFDDSGILKALKEVLQGAAANEEESVVTANTKGSNNTSVVELKVEKDEDGPAES